MILKPRDQRRLRRFLRTQDRRPMLAVASFKNRDEIEAFAARWRNAVARGDSVVPLIVDQAAEPAS